MFKSRKYLWKKLLILVLGATSPAAAFASGFCVNCTSYSPSFQSALDLLSPAPASSFVNFNTAYQPIQTNMNAQASGMANWDGNGPLPNSISTQTFPLPQPDYAQVYNTMAQYGPLPFGYDGYARYGGYSAY